MLVYVVIIALKLQRLEREVDELAARRRRRRGAGDDLRWLSSSSGPRSCFYGEAAVGYFGDARRAGAAGRAATWGVRLGWLAQTALLSVQAAREDGFPWGTWAGSLNLFVWLVVGAYLIWGCRGAYRLLGLAVMPLAAALLVVARAGGGTGVGTRSHYSNLFLVLHVGLVLAAFAGFTLAAGAVGALPLAGAAAEAARDDDPAPAGAVARDARPRSPRARSLFSLPRADARDRRRDRAARQPTATASTRVVVATLVTWAVWVGVSRAARDARLAGRRAAYVALAGFALVIVVRLALPATHFA